MSTTTQTGKNGAESNRSIDIDHGRYVRAHSDAMSVTALAPNMKLVEHNDETYTVDLVGGACDCPDHHYRNEICKHLLRAALVSLYTDGVTTPFIARVARYARENGCIAGGRGCAGPTTIGERGFPCPTCVDAVRSPDVDEWTVWKRLCQRTGARR